MGLISLCYRCCWITLKKISVAEPWSHLFGAVRTCALPSSCTSQWGVQYIIFPQLRVACFLKHFLHNYSVYRHRKNNLLFLPLAHSLVETDIISNIYHDVQVRKCTQ